MSRNFLQENIQLTNSKIQLPCGTIVPIFISNLLSIIYKVRTFSVCCHFYQYRVQFTMCDNFSVGPCLQLSMNCECSVSIDKSRISSIWFSIFLILAIRNLIKNIEGRETVKLASFVVFLFVMEFMTSQCIGSCFDCWDFLKTFLLWIPTEESN